LYDKPVLDVEDVMLALDAMVATAAMQGRQMSVAIVDAWGGLLGALRMDGASTQSFQSAVKRARRAASSGSGAPIRHSDRTLLGGIGIGGANGDEASAVAEAGLKALDL
jgi:uncharacterized protein GlcG (DUF336 family)